MLWSVSDSYFSCLAYSISGCLPALFMSDWFVREQISEVASPLGATAAISVSDHARLVAQQLGNAYGLLFMVGVAVLYTTTELNVVRNYLVALLIADVGHVGLTIATLGPERFAAVGDWNAMTWGNVGFTVRPLSRPVIPGLMLTGMKCRLSWPLRGLHIFSASLDPTSQQRFRRPRRQSNSDSRVLPVSLCFQSSKNWLLCALSF